ncbi:MAG TPA: Fe(2+)-trafficking protein [Phycisphaerales bacterium]|nr:Fe(2+)-trafficking protein [Phycisphaerales bacterium]
MTATIDERIAQFEKMAHDDPDNDMAHFSLGNAYLQAHRASDAARSFQRCIQINPQMSKAYQLGGQALIEAGAKPQAIDVLMNGYEVAARRGDRLPQSAMADLLKSIGREPPAVKAADTGSQTASAGDAFVCRRTGRPGTKLPSPPFRGPVGKWIHENISAETWRTWIGQGTKVINELRLDLSREQDSATYDAHMREFLGIDDELLQQLTRKS